MLRSILPLAIGLACLSLSPAHAAQKGDRQADRAFITQGENALSQAYVTGNDKSVELLLSDDYRGIGSHGTVSDKAATLAAIREEPDESAAAIEKIDVQFHGDTAIARVREKEIGLAPMFKPSWRVITDMWVKTAGKWQIVAAEELDPGSPTLPVQDSAIGEIKALRAASNRAIASHDIEAFLPYFAEDAAFVWSNGTSAAGKAQLKANFARDFADPAFVTYDRAPESLSISDTGLRAVEHGTWSALKREPRGETRYGGDYLAHWAKTPQGWLIQGEVYVKLRCSGPLCTP